MTAEQTVSDKGRPHFGVLDGLRGVAALWVVTFHFLEMVIWDYSKLWLGHAWLAVDFFFCLSGFVMGYAYDGRIEQLGLMQFFKARLIRLHPMVMMGSVLGLIAFCVSPYGGTAGYSPARIALIFTASMLMVPYGTMPGRGRALFGLNAPTWSLFWEYVANIAFGTVLHRLHRNVLLAISIAAAVALCWVGQIEGNLPGGWNATTWWVGGVRIIFSFTAGLLVYRLNWRPRTQLGFGGLGLLLTLALVMPYATGGWVREVIVIVFFFPLLVALGAGTVLTPRMERLSRFSGDLSYPLYMTHYAVIWIWADFSGKQRLAGARLGLWVVAGVVAMVLLSYLVMEFYDKPFRKWLRARGSLIAQKNSRHP